MQVREKGKKGTRRSFSHGPDTNNKRKRIKESCHNRKEISFADFQHVFPELSS